MPRTPTAALVVVGNEVLSAKVQDENGPFTARRLRELGVELVTIRTVRDRVDEVSAAVLALCRQVDWVFTSGGVGPTHDDITVRAVAEALGRPMHRSPALVETIRALHRRGHPGAEPPEAALRMADVPEGTRLLGDEGYPTLALENVVMLPGVPQFYRHQFERIAHLLQAPPFRLACVYLSAGEGEIAPALDAVAAAHPAVEIGSYPRFDAGADHRVKVTLEAKDAARVEAALRALLAALPAGSVLRTEGP
ncbi:molybdopterin binding domain protein [Anaeromyxobacter dehalogenans 2CP-1]|uniref:Molybdopterin binding domain protein n=1 Tax=Anaeromyxobacter dehalogenans (strain ATCC BAA-258 / DSM 21875 / 2CP-1) TaxID=455488 RepID=B8J9E9_ANAD2|nr:competence/damage-inducible protein A [Anaeromyxobacter dehalogenans]ACL65555.1 molybdopterin binding domain protein [Anaeromyxobacter dehalogenans 2CP-1]